ncbi:MAG: type II secretion system major pseudopilin GspG [Phycisphaerales bacterium]
MTRTQPGRPPRTGFSLLELLVVVTIIGLLAALVGPRLLQRAGGTKIQTTKAQISLLTDAVNEYKFDVGTLPTEDQGLAALLTKQGTGPDAKGPYLERATLPNDGWNRPFHYKLDETWGYIIYSLGADGAPGGEGENADFNNRDLLEIP